jgi:hypothetical protein
MVLEYRNGGMNMTRLHPIWGTPDDAFIQLCLMCDTEIDHADGNTCSAECRAAAVKSFSRVRVAGANPLLQNVL